MALTVALVAVNLVGNALKFTERGGITVRLLSTDLTADTALMRFEVCDMGLGIPAEKLARIFEAFEQGDSSTTRRFGGAGLGLAISKRLVEVMGGTIGVNSTPGKGSTFWFTARFAQASPDASEGPGRRDGLRGVRVLLVVVDDDDATDRTVLEQLEAWDMRPTLAVAGREALELIRAARDRDDPYDLAILDLHGPDADGIDLARAVRADRNNAGLRLVMLSVAGPDENPEVAMRAGIEEYLTKPVRQSTLYDRLAGLLGGAAETPAARPEPDGVGVGPAPSLGLRVLLAEDNPVNQEVAIGLLTGLGCHVDVVATGRDAVDAVARAPYDLVLMDCQMPEMDGLMATRAIRDLERAGRIPAAAPAPTARARLPIVALTAHALARDREQCLAAGMDDYLSKPFRQEQLQSVLDRRLGPRTARSCPAAAAGIEESRGVAVAGRSPLDERTLATLGTLGGAGQGELVGRVMRVYVDSAPGVLAALREAMRRGDADAARRAAHSLKSSSANIGALRLAELCRQVEAGARTGNLEAAGRGLPALEAESDLVHAAAGAHASRRRAGQTGDGAATGKSGEGACPDAPLQE